MAQLDGPPGYGGFRPDSMHPLSNSIGMGMAGGPLRPGPADPGSIGMPLYDAVKHQRPSHFEDVYGGGGPVNPNRSSLSPMRRSSHSPNMRLAQP